MKTNSLLCAAVVVVTALFAVQCKNAEQDGPGTRQRGRQVTIEATLEQPIGTKTSLDAERKVLWSAGDQIKVYNSSTPGGVVYTLSDGEGTTAAKFTGTALSGSGPFYAIYPADAGGALNGSDIAVTLPAEQGYVAGSFGSGAAVSVAKAETINKLVFKNVLGGVALSVTSSKPFSGVRLQTKGSEALNGAGTIAVGEGDPSVSVERTSDDNSFLYLRCPEEGVSAPATFVLMLPPGAFSNGFLVEFLDKEGNVMFRSAKAQNSNKVSRSTILDMPATEYSAQYKAAFFESESFGYFPAIGADAALQALDYEEGSGQYAYLDGTSSRRVRVQSLREDPSFYAEITTPKTMSLGESYKPTVNTLVGGTSTSVSNKDFTVLKKTGNRVWLVNPADKTGIIQLMED